MLDVLCHFKTAIRTSDLGSLLQRGSEVAPIEVPK
jgi:hypothetical protein